MVDKLGNFFKVRVILHVVDECIRWTVAVLLKDRSTEEVMEGLVCSWFQPFGPPDMVICDGEGALGGDKAADLLDRWGSNRAPRAPRQHAHLIEVHHEI